MRAPDQRARLAVVLGVALALATALPLVGADPLSVARAHPDGALPPAAEQQLERAKTFVKGSQLKQAEELLDRLAADHRDPRIFELRGYVRMKLKSFDGACADYERGTPGAAYHDVNYAFCLQKAGRLGEAASRYQTALKALDPGDPSYTFVRDQARRLEPLAGARTLAVLADVTDAAVLRLGEKEIGRATGGDESGIPLDEALAQGERFELKLFVVNTEGEFGARLILQDGAARLAEASVRGGDADEDGRRPVELVGVVASETFVLRRSGGKLVVEKRERGIDHEAAAAAAAEIVELEARGEVAEALERARAGQERFAGIVFFHERRALLAQALADRIPLTEDRAEERRALLLEARKAKETRLTALQRVVALVPGEERPALDAAAGATELGKHVEAEKLLRIAHSRRPDGRPGLIALAQCLARQGKGDEATKFADQALKLAPQDPSAHVARADALLAAGKGEEALLSYQRAVEIEPAQGEWIFGKMALAANLGGANALGIQKAEKALEADRFDAAKIRALGDAFLRGLRFEEALSSYESALAQAKDLTGVGARAGLAAELLGRPSPAMAHYARAETDPELKDLAARRLARLQELGAAESWSPPAVAATRVALGDLPAGRDRDRVVAALAKVKEARPELAAALLRLPELTDGDITEADGAGAIRLQRLVADAGLDTEVQLGLDLLLDGWSPRKELQPVVDGTLATSFTLRDRVGTDPQGDAEPAADVTEVLAVVVGESLHVGLVLAGAAAPQRLGYWVELRAEPHLGTVAVGVGGGETTLVAATPDGRRRQIPGSRTGVEHASEGRAVELKIPLRWLRGARRVRVSAFTFLPGTGKKLDLALAEQPVAPVDDGYPPALRAMFRLASVAAPEPSDRIALAIALASHDAFAIGGDVVVEHATEECRRMLLLGRRARDAAIDRGFPPLDLQPLEALLVWASRSTQYRPSTASGLIRHQVSPEALAAMARYAEAHGLVKPSPKATVAAIEAHLGNPWRWQYTSATAVETGARLSQGRGAAISDEEKRALDKFVRAVTVDGLEVTTDGFFNQDLLFDHLVAADALVGHCGNMAQLTADMCRSLGIPATVLQGREERSSLFQSPHAFPIYWDGAIAAFRSVQGERYAGEKPLACYVFLPPGLTRLPKEARSAGGGTHWYRFETTYGELGRSFQGGLKTPWLRAWLEAQRK